MVRNLVLIFSLCVIGVIVLAHLPKPSEKYISFTVSPIGKIIRIADGKFIVLQQDGDVWREQPLPDSPSYCFDQTEYRTDVAPNKPMWASCYETQRGSDPPRPLRVVFHLHSLADLTASK